MNYGAPKGETKMNNQPKSNRETLKAKVVNLVKDFVQHEGGISHEDLEELFGIRGQHEVAAALGKDRRVSFF